MDSSFGDDDLVYPNLRACKLKTIGPAAATSSPPVRLPSAVREAVEAPPYGSVRGGNRLDGCALERAVLKRQEERARECVLRGATSREELVHATVSKMRSVTGAEEDVCIAILKRHRYDVTEAVEAYLDGQTR